MREILVLCLVFGSFLNAGEPDKALHEQCLYPTVMIVCPSGSIGTGVIFSTKKVDKKYRNLVLSCEHVTGKKTDKKEFDVLIRKAAYKNWSAAIGFSEFKGKIIFSDEKTDLSITEFSSEEIMPVAILDMKPELYIGNEVLRVGCAVGEIMKIEWGRITAVDGSGIFKKDSDCIRTSIPTIMGDSGGPVLQKTPEGYKCFGLTQSVRVLNSNLRTPLSEGFIETPYQMFLYHISYVIPIKRIEKQLKDSQ